MDEATRQIISTLETQLSQRLEKIGTVFTWCSSVLISISGGVLLAAGSKDFQLEDSGLVLISLIVVILTIYAYAWINENLKFESTLRDELERIFKEQLNYDKLKDLRPDKAKFGYRVVIILLGGIALTATWTAKLSIITEQMN